MAQTTRKKVVTKVREDGVVGEAPAVSAATATPLRQQVCWGTAQEGRTGGTNVVVDGRTEGKKPSDVASANASRVAGPRGVDELPQDGGGREMGVQMVDKLDYIARNMREVTSSLRDNLQRLQANLERLRARETSPVCNT